MSIPTGGGAGGLAKGANSGAANAGVAKAGAGASGPDAAKGSGKNAAKGTADAAASAAAAKDAVDGAVKGTGNDMARKAGFGTGGGVGSAASEAAANAPVEALSKSPAGAALSASPAGSALQGAKMAEKVSKMGAGGTSAAREGQDDDGSVGKSRGSGLGRTAAVGAAVPAAGVIGQLMFLMMILNWLKMMAFAALAMAANFLSMFFGAILAVGKAILGGIMGIGSAVSGFFGGAISAVTGAVASVTTAAVVATVAVVAVVSGTGNETAQRDGALFDCSSEIVSASLAVTPPPVGGNEKETEDNAKLVYGVLSAWGMADENIAGILGNWDAESGIDPTGVETIFGEPFTLGPKKKDAEEKGFNVDTVAPDYGAQFPGVDLIGIGLGQWSNGRNTQLLDYAKGADGGWHKLETQLGFMISTDSGAPVIKHMITTPIGSPKEAAVYFHHEWERSADSSMTLRETAAEKWFAEMGGWEKNQDLADSILEQSGGTIGDAENNAVAAAQERCLTDNSSAGSAGLTEGGMSLEEAEALMKTYKSEGDAVLAEAFGAGGPGDCGFGKADNCVGFSSYFVWKFTSFKGYARGNGIDTAKALADLTDRETSTTPTAYSVFSMPTGMPEGHTGVILGIENGMAIVGEASCGSNHAGTRAYKVPVSTMEGWVFTDVSDLLTDESMA